MAPVTMVRNADPQSAQSDARVRPEADNSENRPAVARTFRAPARLGIASLLGVILRACGGLALMSRADSFSATGSNRPCREVRSRCWPTSGWTSTGMYGVCQGRWRLGGQHPHG
jgi:hypothetical protein